MSYTVYNRLIHLVKLRITMVELLLIAYMLILHINFEWILGIELIHSESLH